MPAGRFPKLSTGPFLLEAYLPMADLTLKNRTVLIARPKGQASKLAQLLEQKGAQVLYQPAIAIGPPDDWTPVDRAIDELGTFDWVVFSSVNGAQYLFDRLGSRGINLSSGGKTPKLAAIGPATADAVRERGLTVSLTPPEYRAESLADALIEQLAKSDRGENPPRILIARASRGREIVADRLRLAGMIVEQVVVYTSSDVTELDPNIADSLADEQVDWVAVTSSAIARSLISMLAENLGQTRLASISPITTQTLKELGHPPSAEAADYTMAGLVDAIILAEEMLAQRGR